MKTRLIVLGAIAASLLTSAVMAQTPATTTRPEANSASVTQPYKGQWWVSKMIGLDVYNQNNEKLGDISEVLTDPTGKIQTAILGVGGFLGLGERMVAVSFDQLKFVNQPIEAKMASSTQTSTASTKPAETAPQATTGAATTTRPVQSANEQWYPDHAVINLTADQVKALPQFGYN
ncbi:PRC-barrel domain-containing protein [Bradyrhizobium betae]|uniref:PRC-barrel domain containing protein n=1 Tax=Bradyrhizobium betae TaxID=244734 RepID=A0A5P6PC80_9BRAD|nr:PRC-barrel domain-containing protein [Bradyrhizobium betae]MCS3729912.1 sporulation protein YlmC with PRC-barrel domain [Bradyrhizobium betae]QFI75885.1 PRC-barrel domain containing protein [Bradyrhizobium betae]